MWSKLSLRMRISLLSGLMIILTCGVLTLILILNAQVAFTSSFDYVGQNIIFKDGVITTDNNAVTYLSLMNLFDMIKQDYLLRSIIFMVLTVVIGVFITWIIIKRALKPVSDLTKVIENIDVNNLNKPLELPKSHDEIAILTQSFNKMLVKINDSIEVQKRFVHNAAHELKTPIAAILTNIEVLEMDDNPNVNDYQEVIKITKDNIERMSLLVKDLLFINVTSKEQYTYFRFSELDILNSVLVSQIKEKNLTVTVEGDTTLFGNKILLERAFYNIIQNAIRYNKENGKVIVECYTNKIIIKDSGIGIPSDKIARVFEPFYCVDESRSRKLGGSGLGLAIVKQIFDEHKIKFMIESKEKQGTTFTVYLNLN